VAVALDQGIAVEGVSLYPVVEYPAWADAATFSLISCSQGARASPSAPVSAISIGR
jgi:hypothetical protein